MIKLKSIKAAFVKFGDPTGRQAINNAVSPPQIAALPISSESMFSS